MNRRWMEAGVLIRAVAVLGVVGAACMTRPVVTASPNLKTNFTSVLHNQSVDKLDLLFMIDQRPYQAQLAQSEANLAKDKAQLQALQVLQPPCHDSANRFSAHPEPLTDCLEREALGRIKPHHVGLALGKRGQGVCQEDDLLAAAGRLARARL